MIDAIAILLTYLFAALLLALGAVGMLVAGVLKSAWVLFTWPSSWFR